MTDLKGPVGDPTASTSIEFERLLANLSTAFINVPAGETHQRIAAACQQLVRFLGFDHTTVASVDEESGQFRNLASWARPGIEPNRIENISTAFPWWTERMAAEGLLFMPHLPDDLPPEAVAEIENVRQLGLKSILAVGFFVEGALAGAVSFGAIREKKPLTDALIRRIRLIGEIFGNALERSRADTKLRRALSEIEELKDRLEAENVLLREEVKGSLDFEEIIGESAALKRVLKLVDQVCGTDATVLITGETGTGKELIARAVHHRSKRRDRPFVALNCSALPASLIESELFGHEKGAFTGASSRKIGRFELADGGTIFLDEVGELTPELQPKLLRVLQAGEMERVGSPHTLKVDVRVIAATNRFLPAEVEARRFRDDLYYRLAVFPIDMPPLRERSEDVPLLVWYFINRKQSSLNKRIEKIPQRAMDALVAYPWPGNIRELENVVERAMILSSRGALQLDEALLSATERSEPTNRHSLEDVERAHITKQLRECKGRINGKGNAAERLGLKPSTLRFRMKKLRIVRP